MITTGRKLTGLTDGRDPSPVQPGVSIVCRYVIIMDREKCENVPCATKVILQRIIPAGQALGESLGGLFRSGDMDLSGGQVGPHALARHPHPDQVLGLVAEYTAISRQ